MKLVQKCCCGCTVKTGALFICYMALIQAIVPILNILSHTAPDITNDKHLANEYKRHITWLAVVTIVVVAHALYGIYKKKAGYMVPFLMYKLIIMFLLTMMLGFAPAVVDQLKSVLSSEDRADALPGFIVTVLIVIAIEAYSILILFSHYTFIRHETLQARSGLGAAVRTGAGAGAGAGLERGPSVGFTSAVPDMENAYANDLPKKQPPPPPYAV